MNGISRLYTALETAIYFYNCYQYDVAYFKRNGYEPIKADVDSMNKWQEVINTIKEEIETFVYIQYGDVKIKVAYDEEDSATGFTVTTGPEILYTFKFE